MARKVPQLRPRRLPPGVEPLHVLRTLRCGDFRPSDGVEVTGHEEDIQGRDVVTFKCPKCGEPHTAFVCIEGWSVPESWGGLYP